MVIIEIKRKELERIPFRYLLFVTIRIKSLSGGRSKFIRKAGKRIVYQPGLILGRSFLIVDPMGGAITAIKRNGEHGRTWAPFDFIDSRASAFRLPKAIVSRLIGRYLFSGSSQINLHDRSFTVGRNSFSVIYKYVRRGDTRVDCVVRLLQVNATTVQFVNGKSVARTFSTNCVRVKIHQVSRHSSRVERKWEGKNAIR